ncbi:hypothetical protein P0D75_18375 [Paraburkholderia sediminicola]|uniref:hypothetical protein n=1 Tax=Paraburkholderia sediminicola TaxID=458836 RepID=UPI0038BD7354
MGKTITLEDAADAVEEAQDCTFGTEAIAAPAITRTYTVTAHHPPQVLALGRERNGRVVGISCKGRVACTLLDAAGKALISIDADGIDMACDIRFAGGALSVSMKTASSVTFVIQE